MNAEIIAVGSELLLGQITNTNAKFISTQLSEIGVNVYYHTVVGDNPARLKSAIEIAESRANLIIFTGGLGPTKDDLTKHTIAAHLGKQLVLDEQALTYIEGYFKHVGRPMTENNKQQALVMEGSNVLANHYGMAPGMYVEGETHSYVLLPGPPREMNPMFVNELKSMLAVKMHNNAQIISHVLRFYGIGEAELETKVDDILQAQTNPTIAPLASDGEVTLRITAKAQTEEEGHALIAGVEKQLMDRVGEYVYGYNNATLQSSLVALLKERNLTLSAAESLTAGLFMSELTNVAGVSGVLQGGVVTYSVQSKIEQLQISPQLIEQYGVVSSECAEAMALGVKQKFNTDFGVSFTGVAGPDDDGSIKAGTVWLGFAYADGNVETVKLQLNSDRNMNRLRAVKKATSLLIKWLKNN